MIHRIVLKFWREPLFHFLVLGAGLFMVHSLVNGSQQAPADRIVVDEIQAQRLADQFQRTWMRPPTRSELQDLAEDFVKEEILYREALALGLDQDDLVIRRRLRQKMEFINADLTAPQPPTEADLQAYFDAHKDRFRLPDRFSFQQVYLNPGKHTGDVRQTAVELLAHLNTEGSSAVNPNLMGDATLLPAQLDSVTKRKVANTFGREFAKHIDNIPTGRWSGPYGSSYGLHLVRITKRQAGGLPAIAAIQPILEREWYAERRKEAHERLYQAIQARYDVEIRLPVDSADNNLAQR
jgi:hypothetical protein